MCWSTPGRESSLPTLLEALGDERPRALLLTHIHLDHAAATGALVRRWPDLEVYVHERGAPPPGRPLEAAGQRRAPLRRRDGAPLGRDRAGARGEREAPGGRRGHARACASPTPPATPPTTSATCTRRAAPPSSATSPRCAIPPADLVVPPRRRPTSTSRPGSTRSGSSKAWNPERLALTHFGAVENPAEHLETVRERLREEAELARELSEAEYEQRHRDRVAESTDPETAAELIQCVPPEYQWRGLDRYWRKREAA